MTGRELERMLRRVHAQVLPASIAERALAIEIDRLANEPEAAGRRPRELARLFPDALSRFDAATREAHRRLAEYQLTAALAAIREADASLDRLRRMERATAECAATGRARDRWIAALGLAPFLDLPALRIIDRLLARSASLLTAEEPHKSLVVTRLCSRVLARLMARQDGADRGLEQRIERLAGELDPGAGARLAQVRELASGGYLALAGRLADELEIELAGWRTAAAQRTGSGERWRQEMAARLAETAQEAEALCARLLQAMES